MTKAPTDPDDLAALKAAFRSILVDLSEPQLLSLRGCRVWKSTDELERWLTARSGNRWLTSP